MNSSNTSTMDMSAMASQPVRTASSLQVYDTTSHCETMDMSVVYDTNKSLGISSGVNIPGCKCTQICTNWDNIVSLVNGPINYIHSSVLSNLCYSSKEWVPKKTVAHLTQLLTYTSNNRARVVVHYGKKGTCTTPYDQFLHNINQVQFPSSSLLDRPLLLENAAGQGTEIGTNIDEMRYLLERVDKPHLIGTCFDTCHAHAYGYDMSNSRLIEAIINEIDTFSSVKLIHLNDCKGTLGCRVDRHENIGKGTIWSNSDDGTSSYHDESLTHLFNIASEKQIDIILETPDDVSDWYKLQPYMRLMRKKKFH